MKEDTQRSGPDFNTVSRPAVPPPTAENTMALVVDFGVGNMTDEDADNYLTHLGQTLNKLRDAGIPVVWVTMSDRNHLHPPGADGAAVLAGAADMGSASKTERFQRFLREDGPKPDEAVYEKKCEGSFVETSDYASDPKLRTLVAGHLLDEKGTEKQVAGDTGGLTDYARQRGVRHVLVAGGGMSTHCITQTAISALEKDFMPHICLENLQSWTRPQDETHYSPDNLAVWRRHGEVSLDDSYHQAKISARLDEIATEKVERLGGATEQEVHGLTDQDLDIVRNNCTTTPGFIAAMSRPATGPRPVQQRGMNI